MYSVEKHKIKLRLLHKKFLLIFLLTPLFCNSQDSILSNKNSKIQVHGYLKDMQSVSFIDNSKSLVTGNLIHNRINFRWDIFNNVYARIEARNRLFYGEQVKSTYNFGKYVDVDNGITDLSYNVIDDTSLVLNTIIDRALINWYNDKFDITIGRQRINWGVNLVWNPNDIFNAFNYFDFDYEERPGSDAIRVQYNTPDFSSIEFACKFSNKGKDYVAAMMYKTNFKKFDLQNFAGIYFDDIVIGTGWAGNIKNTGFKGEVSLFKPYKNFSNSAEVLSASVSFDRSFKNNYFGMVSYLYGSQGKGLKTGINELTGVVLSAKKLSPFEHSFFIQVSKSINPLLSGSMASIFSPKNNTLILLPSLALSVSNNWDLALIAQSFFSDSNGTFRTLGNGIYLRLRWSY